MKVMTFQGEESSEQNTIDLDPGLLVKKLDSWVDGAIRLLPNIVVALLFVVMVWFAAKYAKRLVEKAAAHRSRNNLGVMLGGFVRTTLLVAGTLMALTIVTPSIKPGDLIAGLGVSSVAIGFAFKDILQNWLAGFLILLRQPFEVGDVIEVGDYTGRVESIETRCTMIKTFDSQQAVVPNSQLYTNAVLVKSAYPKRRSEYDVGIGYADDLDRARETLLEVLRGVDGVETDPEPEVIPWDLAASWVTLRLRWWIRTHTSNIVKVRGRVIEAVKYALDREGIDMPYETVVQLQHDQTEEGDGDRSAQREGWPAPKSGSTVPRWKAQERERGNSKT